MVLDKAMDEQEFLVIHPLDDVQEKKLDTRDLGPMRMTPTVRIALWALRGYLIVMMVLVFYHVLELAGIVPKN
ncbi:MAG TPA: hypothetical protein VNH18_24040 [Bryobacteraceae bacterium]|nr:hypothetical protein [Bryobacteraceae bacterium]